MHAVFELQLPSLESTTAVQNVSLHQSRTLCDVLNQTFTDNQSIPNHCMCYRLTKSHQTVEALKAKPDLVPRLKLQ